MSDYEKITPDSSNRGKGDFVKTLQGQFGTGVQGGTHVHKDWWAKTLSYDDVMNKVQADIDNREDIMIPAKNIIRIINCASLTREARNLFRLIGQCSSYRHV